MTDRLAQLSAAGVAVWLDDLSRVRADQRLAGQAAPREARGRRDHEPDASSRRRSSDADAYDDQVKDLAARGVDVEEAIRMMTTYDVRWACDVMRPAYDASRGVDGRVSIEVDPRLAHDTDSTVAEAKTLWWLVDRPNLFIKIPATPEGLPAITATLAEGISVNVTLIFCLERYREVMDAFLAGMEQAKANGHDLSKIGSVASFFVSRVDTEVDKRLDKIGTRRGQGAAGQGRDRQRPARVPARTSEVFGSDRWQALADAGRAPAAAAVGVHLDQEPGLQGHHLRRGADRARRGQHHAGAGRSTPSPTTARSAATP